LFKTTFGPNWSIKCCISHFFLLKENIYHLGKSARAVDRQIKNSLE
jgi:hypothetical protein